MTRAPLTLRPEEPALGPWTPVPVADLAAMILEAATSEGAVPETAVADTAGPGARGTDGGRPVVVAIDGRGGAGKTTVTEALRTALAARGLEPAVVHADDVAWWEPYFTWGHLLRDGVLAPVRVGGGVDFRPPAWESKGRAGSIAVPASADVLLIEGTGAAQEAVGDLVDVVIWVQSDWDEARRRGLARDVEHGLNGDAQQSEAFWDEWMAAEVPFFARDRPWDRAAFGVCGTPETAGIDLAPGDLAVAVLDPGEGYPHPDSNRKPTD